MNILFIVAYLLIGFCCAFILVLDGMLVMNSSGNGLQWDNVSNAVISNLLIINTADEGVFIARTPGTNPEMGGVTICNAVLRNTGDGLSLDSSQATVVSNVYVEASQGEALVIRGAAAPRDAKRIQISNIMARNCNTLGPFIFYEGTTGTFRFVSDGDVTLSNFQIRDSQGGGGVAFSSLSAPLNNIKLSNGVIDNVPLMGILGFTSNQVLLDNITIRDTGDMGCLLTGNNFVKVTNLIAERTAKTLDGNGYGPNNAFTFWSNTNFIADNLTILDNQTTATGYTITTNAEGASGRISNVTAFSS